jgi:hypothetical protein
MLKRYSQFKEDILLEKILLESIVYFSPDFRKKLKMIDSPISAALSELEGNNIKKDITLIDLDDQEGYVSFKTMSNAKKQGESESENDFMKNIDNRFSPARTDVLWSKNSPVWEKSRNPIKIGRLVNNLLPDKFDQQKIEDFINKYKALQTGSTEKLRVVEGDEIFKWYSVNNYLERKGQLGSSCMRNGKEDWFKIYTNNPEVCKMLILTDLDENGDEKLKGRALVWKLSKKTPEADFEWFLDRQYTSEDSDVEKMRNFAKEQGWAFKSNNNHHSFSQVTYKDEQKSYYLEVQVKKENKYNYDYGMYPYLDTFRRYNPHTGILYNDDDDDDGYYLLDDTGGSYSDTSSSSVYSEYAGDMIPEDESVWSDDVDSYIWRDEARHVSTGYFRHHGWYPADSDNLNYDGWNEEWIHIDDSVFSEHYDYAILSDESISAIMDIQDDGELKDKDSYYVHENDSYFINLRELDKYDWFQKINYEFKWEDYHSAISKDLLTKDFEGDWILKILQIKLYKVDEPIMEMEWFSEMDSKVLDLKIDKDSEKNAIESDYNKELLEKGIIKMLINAYKRIEDKLVLVPYRASVENNKNVYNKKLKDRRLKLIEILVESEE